MNYQHHRPLRFGEIPPVTKNIILVCSLLFIFTNYIKLPIDLNHYLDLHTINTGDFMPHQFITHIFMHLNFSHILFNMFGLYMFGSKLETLWGAKRFINFFLICGILAGLIPFLYDYYKNAYSISLGASGAISGLLGAMFFLFPNSEISIYMLPPLKYKIIVPIYMATSIYNTYLGVSNIGHLAHLTGLITGIIIVFVWNKTNKETLY